MKRSMPLIVSLLSALLLAVGLLAVDTAAQQKTLKDQLVGTWTFVSSTGKLPDGSSAWGANPTGLLIFTDNGRYSSIIVRSDLPKFAAKNRMQGTARRKQSCGARKHRHLWHIHSRRGEEELHR